MTCAAQQEDSASFASEIDAFTFGEHRVAAAPSRGATPRFGNRLTSDGSSGFLAEPDRYHLYAGWFCPRSQRATIQLALNGLTDFVTVSYVDGLRDGRGWAFRERTGPDTVNGFTLLREAYEASDLSYDGPISVPVLWDRHSARVVSNNSDTIDLDFAAALAARSGNGVNTYPHELRGRIDESCRESAELAQCIVRAVYFEAARAELRARLHELDTLFARRRFLLGDRLTVADVRLWVILARYDAGPNATGAAGPRLTEFTHLWEYARDLYALPAFRSTTNFRAFATPLTPLADWDRPADRSRLTSKESA